MRVRGGRQRKKGQKEGRMEGNRKKKLYFLSSAGGKIKMPAWNLRELAASSHLVNERTEDSNKHHVDTCQKAANSLLQAHIALTHRHKSSTRFRK